LGSSFESFANCLIAGISGSSERYGTETGHDATSIGNLAG
jgi:hypothetical protein